jgi:hypothetical protein
MNRVEFLIKNKNNFPRIVGEVYASDELLAEYEVNISEDINNIDISLIEQYSQELSSFFDQIILEMKNNGFNSNAFGIRIAILTEILRIKTQCDQYIERMDVIE